MPGASLIFPERRTTNVVLTILSIAGLCVVVYCARPVLGRDRNPLNQSILSVLRHLSKALTSRACGFIFKVLPYSEPRILCVPALVPG